MAPTDWDEAPELPPGVRATPPEKGVPPRGWVATEALLPEGSVPSSRKASTTRLLQPSPHHCPTPLPDLRTQRQRLCLTKLTSLHRLDSEVRDGRTEGATRHHIPVTPKPAVKGPWVLSLGRLASRRPCERGV